jgi:bifunctional UDP-N-acetylglucosamine pyrophosphorylase/glucosamine-1-phosphate N-acetyltransferase
MHLSVVILAAGLGKRMKSNTPKVLHEALGKPMLQYVIDAVKPLTPEKIIIVIGNGADDVKKRFRDERVTFVLQKKLLGTGDAVMTAEKHIKRGTVLVLNGDGPLITTRTLRGFLSKHNRRGNTLSFLSFRNDSLSGYGRVFRDEAGKVTGIVEDKHASPAERLKFKELNGGVYLIDSDALHYLKGIKKNSASGEYYLTDIVGMVSKSSDRLEAYECPSEDILGINSREDLFNVSRVLRKRILSKWMDKGVTFIDPNASLVHSSVSIGKDTVIYPNTYLEGSTSIGQGCTIFPGSRICDSTLGKQVTIKDNTLIEKSRIYDGASIGPCAHIRPDSVIGRDAKIGNFVEVKKATIGTGSKASHLTYLGDAEVGPGVNIGAGTITCNYDGKNKLKTVIESGVFIGSDTQLVAPVKIGKDAYVAAGATITNDVPSGALAISRAKQNNVENWIKRKREVRSKELRVRGEKKKR